MYGGTWHRKMTSYGSHVCLSLPVDLALGLKKNQLTNLNLILQRNIEIYKYTNNIETQTKKSVNDFCSSRPVQLFSSLWHILVWSVTALRSPLLHIIAGSVNQISGDELCHRINDYIDENKISKSIIFLLHLQTHGTFYDGIFFGYRCWRC